MTANADPGSTRAGPRNTGEGAHAVNGGAHDTTGVGDDVRTRVRDTGGDIRHDRIRWGAVWTGALTALTVYLVLQLLFFALGWLDLGDEGNGTTRAIVSGVLALIAFFIGGAAAGASALWRRANDGMVNGIVAWAVSVVGLLAFGLLGGGALAGALADTVGQFVDLQSIGADVNVAEATQAAQQTAGWAALGLGLSMVAAALGGLIGAKLWPGRDERDAHRR
ncbi:MAG TPA: hypothetical protein VEZ42_17760 [Pseudonocardia sp.]|nr:hypothetical protein [Pseudonocardia sp.]